MRVEEPKDPDIIFVEEIEINRPLAISNLK